MTYRLNAHRNLILLCLLSLFLRLAPSHLRAYELPTDFKHAKKEDLALIRDLLLLNFPPYDWIKGQNRPIPDPVYDVVIIGAGMGGLSAATALLKEGIFNLKLFDQNPPGFEGPWITYARMKTLRSYKEIMGPALGIPHLTFHAWYEALFGAESWRQIEKIPNALWMDYLKWYREALQLPVENDCVLTDLIPQKEGFELHFLKKGEPLVITARKVVLATGRDGFGGPYIPEFAKHLPQSICAHTMDRIDFKSLHDCSIGIIGVGASSFDAAATALEAGAKKVDLIMRREKIGSINKFAGLPFNGFNHAFFKLSDQKRWEFMSEAFDAPIPPPIESIKRVEGFSNLRVLANREIKQIMFDGTEVILETNQGALCYDFLILGTGYEINGYQEPELRHVIDDIALWKDRLPQEMVNQHPKMAAFPYLGPSFEFLPKQTGNAPYLKHLYCFNYASTLSHGLLSADIPAISIGATRLAEAIAADLFIENSEWYLNSLKNYDEKDFEETDYILNIEK
ncbi:MAG: NAD(P)-binding domain-containing protein [Parachlamydiaceae bacterium]